MILIRVRKSSPISRVSSWSKIQIFLFFFHGASLMRSYRVVNLWSSVPWWYLTMSHGTRYPIDPPLWVQKSITGYQDQFLRPFTWQGFRLEFHIPRWALSKGYILGINRFRVAVQVDDHPPCHNIFQGKSAAASQFPFHCSFCLTFPLTQCGEATGFTPTSAEVWWLLGRSLYGQIP